MKKLLSSALSIGMLFSFVLTPCIAGAAEQDSSNISSKIVSVDSKKKNKHKFRHKAVKKILKNLDEDFYRALCGRIDKIDPATEEAFNDLLKPIVDEMLGFKYDPEKDIYYTREDSLQKYFGFGDLYDKMGPLLGMKIDELPIVFRYKHKDDPEKEWLIEFWKGQYGGGLAIGAEIGVYNRVVKEGMKEYLPGNHNFKVFFDSARGREKMYLSYVLCDKKERPIFSRNSAEYKKPVGEPKNKDWWLLGIKLGSYSKSENLILKSGIKFLSAEMAQKFAEAAQQQFPKEIKDLRQEDRVVTFTWSK